MTTWRDLYHDEIKRQAGFFDRARELGQSWLVIDGRTYDPTRMSPATIGEVSRREAERILNYAINQENAAARKVGRAEDRE